MSFTINHPLRTGPEFEFRSRLVGDESPLVQYVTPGTGKTTGGTAVMIKGLNFIADGLGQIGVTFGGQPATSIVVVDRQTITCVTPAFTAAGKQDVAVTVGTKTSILPGGFVAWETVVTSINPNHGPISGGTTVTLFGNGFELGSTITFDGVAATNVIWIDSRTMQCVTPAHATGFVSVVVTGP